MNNRIIAVREALGLDQCEFAKRLEVSQSTISYWERGTHKPAKTKYPNFERVGINTRWLETGEGTMFLPNINALPDEVNEIINIYRKLSPQQRALLGQIARQFLKD